MINKLQTILYLLVFGSLKLDKQNQSYERKKKLSHKIKQNKIEVRYLEHLWRDFNVVLSDFMS